VIARVEDRRKKIALLLSMEPLQQGCCYAVRGIGRPKRQLNTARFIPHETNKSADEQM
jgi:hypothetical protein